MTTFPVFHGINDAVSDRKICLNGAINDRLNTNLPSILVFRNLK